jgi:capsid portal protein
MCGSARLPPLFLGYAADYNFATAQTSYMVAEARVFEPERTEFDDLMNKTIIKELGSRP